MDDTVLARFTDYGTGAREVDRRKLGSLKYGAAIPGICLGKS